jgi:streptogramin lyase
MHTRLFIIAMITTLALALAGLGARAAGLAWSEAGLKAGGQPAEVNAGAGFLVVSDGRANEVWRIDPVTGAYTVFSGLTGVIDARPDAAGNISVSDWSAKTLVRIGASGTATSWPVNALVLWGLALDGAGRVWAADSAGTNGRVFRFDPASHELCSYLLPDGGAAEYPVYGDGKLWLGDYANGRILRLDPGTGGVTWWQIGGASWPEGLALDAAGRVWFADYNQSFLGRLEPSTNQLKRYTPPAGTMPAMIALISGRLWYTEQGTSTVSGTVGVLDPAVAAGQTASVATGSGDLSPSCTTLGAGTSTAVTTRNGTLAFTDLSPTLLADAGGWTVYGLPAGSSPWGIAEAAGSRWIADGGRQKLLRVTDSTGSTATPTATATATATGTSTPTSTPTAKPSHTVYLPLITRR